MKKSLLAVLCLLFGFFAVSVAYAEELPQLNGDESVATEQLPPLTDPSAATDSDN